MNIQFLNKLKSLCKLQSKLHYFEPRVYNSQHCDNINTRILIKHEEYISAFSFRTYKKIDRYYPQLYFKNKWINLYVISNYGWTEAPYFNGFEEVTNAELNILEYNALPKYLKTEPYIPANKNLNDYHIFN